jgi:hypothetical protein
LLRVCKRRMSPAVTSTALLMGLLISLLQLPLLAQQTPAELDAAFAALEAFPKGDRFAPVKLLSQRCAMAANECAPMVLKLLKAENERERPYLQNDSDIDGGMEFVGDVVVGGRNPFLKDDLAEIIADNYYRFTPEDRRELLGGLSVSITPSTFDPPRLGGLIHQFVRIGRDGIDKLFDLARHSSSRVRCAVAERLDSVASLNGVGVKLDCAAAPDVWTKQLAAFSDWWEKHPEARIPPAVDTYLPVRQDSK